MFIRVPNEWMFDGAVLSLLLARFCLADSWHYPTPGPDGSIGPPENWEGLCESGRRQSPIDLSYKAAVKGIYPELTFHGYDELLLNASIMNTGHTAQITLGDSTTSILGGGLRNKYILEQFHFHWSSEHTIDDTRYALELHLVHRHAKYSSVEQASTGKVGIAVLAILFHVNAQPNPAIQAILNAVAPLKQTIDIPIPFREQLRLDQLLPTNPREYFRYEGSLTTPVCAESVVWTVFPASLPISLDQLQEFQSLHDLDDKPMLANYRSAQSLYARALVLVDDSEPTVSGTRHVRNPAIALAISAVLSLLWGSFFGS